MRRISVCSHSLENRRDQKNLEAFRNKVPDSRSMFKGARPSPSKFRYGPEFVVNSSIPPLIRSCSIMENQFGPSR
jgi:hypothetical protein